MQSPLRQILKETARRSRWARANLNAAWNGGSLLQQQARAGATVYSSGGRARVDTHKLALNASYARAPAGPRFDADGAARAHVQQVAPSLVDAYDALFPELLPHNMTAAHRWQSLVGEAMSLVEARAATAAAPTATANATHHAASSRGRIVIAVADYNWRELVLNWIAWLDHHGIRNYLVLSVDLELHQYLVARGVPSFYHSVREAQSVLSRSKLTARARRKQSAARKRHEADWAQYHAVLWYERWRLIGAILARGYDVVHSDVDAIWVSDPAPLFDTSAHIIAGRGAADQDWLVCMGWIFMRAGPPVQRLFEPFLAKIVELRDDQRALNYVLAHRTHLAWDRDPYGPAAHPGSVRPAAAGGAMDDAFVGTSKFGGLQVLLLPNAAVRRFNCLPGRGANETLVVAHCRGVFGAGQMMTQGASSDEKRAGLQALGLWRLE